MFHQLLPYFMLAAALIAGLVVFVSLKRDIHRQAHRSRLTEEGLARLRSAAEVAARARAALEVPLPAEPAEPIAEQVVATSTLRLGINLNRRVQALRMLRRGEDVGHIATALAVPRAEIELLVRVQQQAANCAAKSVATGD